MSSEKRPDDPKQVREMVSEGYARVVREASSCCGSSVPGADETARKIGYEEEQLEAVPDGANLGVGCGNPTAIDSLRPGEVVVDLGSGAGMDSFLAARQVGETGRVIGIDMTDAMLEKARENARKGGFDNVEFRKGFIEELPLEDESVDVIRQHADNLAYWESVRDHGQADGINRPLVHARRSQDLRLCLHGSRK